MASDKKKFVIKPFRPRNHMDTQAAQTIWQALARAIDEIHQKNASSLSFEELYRNAYNLVLHKHGELLYKGVHDAVEDHLRKGAEVVAAAPDERLLAALNARWQDHGLTMVMVRDILMYMDRTYVTQSKKTPVYDMGLELFRHTVTYHEQIKGRLQALLLEGVRQERDGQLLDRTLFRSTLAMLVELGVNSTAVYEELFEKDFLQVTKEFYQAESQDYMAQNTCPDYMRKAETRLNEEAGRAAGYLNTTTAPKLKQIAESELIANHAKALVDMENTGCIAMFKDDKIDDLRRMYDLFSRVPATLDDLRNSMGDFVRKTGRELVMDQEGAKEPVAFVHGLLELRDKYERIVNQAFRAETKAAKKLKESFEAFINLDSRVASYLALYVDDLLKSGLRGMGEAEAEAQLDKVVVIFRYLQDKDVFENFYKVHLSKRLLNNRSVSDESERAMIGRLKSECGYQFTSKLEGMFTDMRISRDVMDTYSSRVGNRAGGLELEVNVLTTGYWPTQTVPMCRLPPNVVEACEAFETFYLQSYTGRKMTWQAHMGSADVRAAFGGGRRYELNVTTYQMCILMLFNTAETLTLTEIRDGTNIAEAELRRHLVSLTTAKHKVLRKASKGKGVADDDSFTFNAEFTSKLKRVRVPLVSMKETGDPNKPAGEEAGLPAAVEEGRRLLIDAAVVRIMKTRKTMSHNDLLAEATKQLSSRFVPSPVVIKKRIEALIEREFLERDASDRRLYNYLA